MDKRVVLSVAGSGKTSLLIDGLDEERRFLIVTYTDANKATIRQKIIKRFGHFPANVTLLTYFTFLHGFCYRPFLRSEKNSKGLTFTPPGESMFKLTDDRRYMTTGRRLYSNRLAKFIEQSGQMKAVIARIEKYYDALFVDEVQDFGGHDFNFLLAISAGKSDFILVGDFFQHTFDTSRDGNTNAGLHDDYEKYKARFTKAKLRVDTECLKKSRRCSKTVCDFISDKIGIAIEAHEDRETVVRMEEDPAAALALYRDSNVVKFFYQTHYKYTCHSNNWGASKGIDTYQDVCVVLNPETLKAWRAGSFIGLNVKTRNKLYVACSRARGNLTFIPDSLLKAHKRT
ncbi:MAG: DNA helicase UvrD [Janthinobacterium lividum]